MCIGAGDVQQLTSPIVRSLLSSAAHIAPCSLQARQIIPFTKHGSSARPTGDHCMGE